MNSKKHLLLGLYNASENNSASPDSYWLQKKAFFNKSKLPVSQETAYNLLRNQEITLNLNSIVSKLLVIWSGVRRLC